MDTFGSHKFVVKEYQTFETIGGKSYTRDVIGIGIELPNGVVLPHPLTNYIKGVYRRKAKSLSSQRNPAYELTKFLNFVNERVREGHEDFAHLKGNGLYGLSLLHGARYITYMTAKTNIDEKSPDYANRVNPDYVYRVEKYLIKFYDWLNKQKIISESFDINDEDSPFDDLELGTQYPGRNEDIKAKLVDFGDNRYELAVKFIRIAELVAPEIALGICFQFFGGLRVGEVVNLTKQSLDYPNYWDGANNGGDRFILKVRDNQKELFQHRKITAHEQVKNPRDQSLLVNSVLSAVYTKHKQRLKKLEAMGIVKNKSALFVSQRTGEAISGKRYYEKFMEIKKKFLDQLVLEENIDDYEFLTKKVWSTHICRGVFTNFLISIGATVTQIAIARGDKNINSALAYCEELNALKLSETALNKVREAYEKQKAVIEKDHMDKWKEEFKYAG